MKIELLSKPLSEIRNDQVGDWTHNPDGSITAMSAEMGNEDYEFLVSVHEMIEAYLCKKRGITDEAVTAFDVLYEEERERGDHGVEDEDGDDPRAPYCKEHFFATNVERQLAAELGVNWSEYEAAIYGLFE